MMGDWLRGIGERYLYSREYVTYAARSCRWMFRGSPEVDECRVFCPTNRHDRTRGTDIAYVLNSGGFPAQKAGEC